MSVLDLPTLYLSIQKEGWVASFRKPAPRDVVGSDAQSDQRLGALLPPLPTPLLVPTGHHVMSAPYTVSTEFDTLFDEPQPQLQQPGAVEANSGPISPARMAAPPRKNMAIKMPATNLLFVDIGITKSVIWLFEVAKQDVQLKHTVMLEEAGLKSAIDAGTRLENTHETLAALDTWLERLLNTHPIPDEVKVKAPHCVVTLNSSVVKSEKRLSNNPDSLECVTTAMQTVFTERLKPLGLIDGDIQVAVLSLSSEAQYERKAAHYLYGKVLSCVASISSYGFQVAHSNGSVTIAAVGSLTPESSELTKEQLWTRQIAPALNAVSFGFRALFIGGFVHAVTELAKWLNEQGHVAHFRVTASSLKGPVPVAQMQEVFASPEMKLFLSAPGIETKTIVSIFFLQQMIMCGTFSPSPAGEPATIQFRNWFEKLGKKMKLHYSLGWCIEHMAK